jgi:hypothetical protein
MAALLMGECYNVTRVMLSILAAVLQVLCSSNSKQESAQAVV